MSFFGSDSKTYTSFDPTATAPGVTMTGAGSPSTPITVSTAGSNSPVSPTVNNVPTSNVGAGGNLQTTAPILSNVTSGGDLGIFVSNTDFGAVKAGTDLAGYAIQQVADNTSHSLDVVSGVTLDSLHFAAGLAQGYATQIAQLQTQTQQNYGDVLQSVNDLSGRLVTGLGNELHSTVAQLSQDQMASLAFFGTETDKLQTATVNAINTVATRSQSENAQGLVTLQSTFVKIAAGLAVAFVATAFILKGKI